MSTTTPAPVKVTDIFGSADSRHYYTLDGENNSHANAYGGGSKDYVAHWTSGNNWYLERLAIEEADIDLASVQSDIDNLVTSAATANVGLKYTATIKDADGYSTLVLPFDADKPEGLTVYTLTVTNGDAIMGEEVSEITNNKPVLLKGSVANDYVFTAKANIGCGNDLTNGLLTGVYTSTTAEAGWYVLQKHDETYGFYQVNETTPTIKPFRAYMPGTLGGGAKALTFNLDGTDALQTLTTEQTAVREVYTLGGTRINTVQRGVNLLRMQDGSVRKVIVK